MADGNVYFSEKLARRRLTLPYKRELRANAEAAIDRLITLIDAIDNDPDFEPNLGSNGASSVHFDQLRWAAGVTDDREEQCEDEGADQGDDEPNADDQDCTWFVTPFAMDQQGTFWANGERPLGKNSP